MAVRGEVLEQRLVQGVVVGGREPNSAANLIEEGAMFVQKGGWWLDQERIRREGSALWLSEQEFHRIGSDCLSVFKAYSKSGWEIGSMKA